MTVRAASCSSSAVSATREARTTRGTGPEPVGRSLLRWIPRRRFGSMLSFDDATSQMILFSGFTNSGLPSDTWQWTGTDWAESSPATSSAGDVLATDDLRPGNALPAPAQRRRPVGHRRDLVVECTTPYGLTGKWPPMAASSASVTHPSSALPGGTALDQPIAGMATTPDGGGLLVGLLWRQISRSTGTPQPSRPTTAAHQRLRRRHGDDARRLQGHWVVTSDGGVFKLQRGRCPTARRRRCT